MTMRKSLPVLALILAAATSGCAAIENDLDRGLAYGQSSEELTRKADADRPPEWQPKSVNAFLWRAAMETVGFRPLSAADPATGRIETEWESAPGNPDERSRFRIAVLGGDLRRDLIRVEVAREVRDGDRWIGAAPASGQAQTLEDSILVKARDIRRDTQF